MGGSRILGNITQPNVESRFLNLATPVEAVIDSSIHPDEKMLRGTLLGKRANGKHRAYFEANVAAGGAFAITSPGFTLEDNGQDIMKHLRIGDTIQSGSGTALGVVLTFNPVTGVGTLAANSASVLAAGQPVRVVAAELALAAQAGRILKSETIVTAGSDEPVAAYTEGFFIEARVIGATVSSKAVLGSSEPSLGEMRLR